MTRTATPATYTVEEAAAQLGVGRNACYEACHRGEIPNVRIGKRIVIPRAAFDRMLESPQPTAKK
jgi:excisionase family DNA binding protein